MRPAFLIHAWNKGPYVYKSVAGALLQTHPCDIYLSDIGSTDQTVQEMERAIFEMTPGAEHRITMLKCPLQPRPNLISMNEHVDWCIKEICSRDYYEWLFTSSADDFSLPSRVEVCLKAAEQNPCSVIATTQFFAEAGQAPPYPQSGFPTQSGYVHAGEGIARLAYGSVIAAYSLDFIARAGSCGRHTPDVYWGYLAALDKGFYVVCDPQHVHVNVQSVNNTGFQGKLAGARDAEEVAKLTELNHWQLHGLYLACYERAMGMFGNIPDEHKNPLVEMIINQSAAWQGARADLHAKNITPGILR